MRYMGIDPGKSGGIAVVDPVRRLVYATKMPDTLRGLLDVIGRHAEGTICYLEQVHSMPKDGGKASFTFGRGFGNIEMALTIHNVQWALVLPQTWQRAMNTLTGGDKNITKAKAQRMFPRLNVTHAIADALLIATYCRHVHEAPAHGEEDRKEDRKEDRRSEEEQTRRGAGAARRAAPEAARNPRDGAGPRRGARRAL